MSGGKISALTVSRVERQLAKTYGSLRPSGVVGGLWGVALLWKGSELFRAVQRHDPELIDDDAIILLGIRHLAQGTLQLVSPRMLAPEYAAVDFLHAASMVAVAVKQPRRRWAAVVSGAVAALSCVMAIRAVRRADR